jgi:hypothetical protein
MIRRLSLLPIHDHAERKDNRDESKRIGHAHRGWIVLVGLCLLTTATASAQAPCWSTTPVSCMLKSHTPLLYPGGLQVFNLYWADNWDQRPAHIEFQITDIDNATKALLSSNYFDSLGQYGIQGLAWNGSTNTNRALIPCVRNPFAQDTIFSVFAFMACMEASGPVLGGVPIQVAAPTGNCVCATLPGGCYNNVTDPCALTPNATGNTIYNIFLPKGTILKDGAGAFVSCTDYLAFHFQIPSLPIPVPPFGYVPGSQGRPLYFTVIPTACFMDIDTMMAGVSHELAEAATDPLPLFHWYDESRGFAIPNLDELALQAKDTEVADLCRFGATVPYTYTPPSGPAKTFHVAKYWSNKAGGCVAGGLPGPITLPIFVNITGIGGFYSSDDDDRHIIVGSGNGDVAEIFYETPNSSGSSVLTNLAGTVSVAGFFSSDDNTRHALIGTNDGNVTEFFYNSQGHGQSVLTNLDGIIGVAGFFSSDDNTRHALIGTNDGNVTEFFYNSQGHGQSVLTNLNGIVGVAGFLSSDDDTRHALIATKDGNVTEFFYNSQGHGQSVLTNLNGIVGVAGFFSPDDNFRHAIIATNDGDVTDFFYNPHLGSGQYVLAHFDGIVGVAGFLTLDANTRHVIVATNDGRLHEVSYNAQGIAIR